MQGVRHPAMPQPVNRLFDLSGGRGLFDSAPLQRFHRDTQAVAHRDVLTMDLGC